MSKLRSLLAPALLGTCLSLTGCTGINPFNWANTDMPCCQHGSCCDDCGSPMMSGEEVEYHGGPLMQARSHGLLSRGILREHWNLARSFEENGDTEQAAAHYEKILSIQPDYAPAHHRLGVLATMWGRFGDADEHFRLARRIRTPETATEDETAEGSSAIVAEENYIQENIISERAAEEKVRREIAVEQSKAGQVAGMGQQVTGPKQQVASARPARRRYQIGARLVDAYYAQQERRRAPSAVVPPEQSIPEQQIAGNNRNLKTMTTATTSKASSTQAASRSSSSKYYEKAARTQPRPVVKERFVEAEEQVEEASETEEVSSTTQNTRSNVAPQATIRPTASSVRPASTQAPLSRSAEMRKNVLRPQPEEQTVETAEISKAADASQIAENESETAEIETVAESKSTATSGIRRISNQEPDSFEAEERQYAETIERLSAVREREKSAKADFLEAEVEERVAHELEVSLAERRVRLANAQLRLAQQQLNSAIKSAGGEVPANLEVPVQRQEETAQPIESLDGTVPERSSESRESMPVPRRLKVRQTSAVESHQENFLAEAEEPQPAIDDEDAMEPSEFAEVAHEGANSPSPSEDSGIEQASANMPAEASGMRAAQLSKETESTEQEPQILLTSHEAAAEPAEFDPSDANELPVEEPVAEAENATVRARHAQTRVHHLPDERAHQVEQPVRTLDEQTLRPREVALRTTFTKKATVLPPSVLYR